MSHDVFISYSSKDKIVADATCAAFEARQIRCWIAPRDLLPGIEYGEAIINGIEACKVMVLVFSAQANESTHIRKEVERGVNKGKEIVPFQIENVLPSKAMEYFLSNTHWLDALTPPLEKRIEELVNCVTQLLLLKKIHDSEKKDLHLSTPVKVPEADLPQMFIRVVGFLNTDDGGFRLSRLTSNDIAYNEPPELANTIYHAYNE